jgi:hypothetical protein
VYTCNLEFRGTQHMPVHRRRNRTNQDITADIHDLIPNLNTL